MTRLSHVDPSTPRSRLTALMAFLGRNRAANVVSRMVLWRLDPWLLRLTRGRVASTLVIPTDVLETRGARTGARRHNAVIYFHDGLHVVLAASNAGAPRDPDWFHNLRAHPDVTFAGTPMHAAVVDVEVEQERPWALADRVFPAFADYRRRAATVGRRIPLVVLEQDPTRSVRG